MADEEFPRWPSRLELEECALSLVSALLLAARTGGQPAFDSVFEDGRFDRLYALSYRIAKYDPKHAQRLTSQVLLSTAARSCTVAEVSAAHFRRGNHGPHDPTRSVRRTDPKTVDDTRRDLP